jgi:hypothetical protein
MDSELQELVLELSKHDKELKKHLKDLILLAKNLPMSYQLASMTLATKVNKYRK